jgi:hypothetical protein
VVNNGLRYIDILGKSPCLPSQYLESKWFFQIEIVLLDLGSKVQGKIISQFERVGGRLAIRLPSDIPKISGDVVAKCKRCECVTSARRTIFGGFRDAVYEWVDVDGKTFRKQISGVNAGRGVTMSVDLTEGDYPVDHIDTYFLPDATNILNKLLASNTCP